MGFRNGWRCRCRGNGRRLVLIGRELGVDVIDQRGERGEIVQQLAEADLDVEFLAQRLGDLRKEKGIEAEIEEAGGRVRDGEVLTA